MTFADLQPVNRVIDAYDRLAPLVVDAAVLERIARMTGVDAERVRVYLRRAGVDVDG
jgi:hypothetical protein